MGSGEFGGDSSVEWKIVVGNVRRSTVRNCSIGDSGYEQGGVDETAEGELFTVSVKMRKEPGAFVQSLRAAAEEAAKYAGQPGYVVSFVLPIERQNRDQVAVRWRSAEGPIKASTRSTRAAGAARTARKGTRRR